VLNLIMNIRLAHTSDIETILRLMPIYYEFDHLEFGETKARNALQEFLSNSTLGRFWLLESEENKEAIGYIAVTFGFSFEYGGKVALVDELFVLESYRGKGFGSQAIQYAQQECKKLGFRAMRLEVTKSNQDVIRLYEKLGFNDLGRSLLTYHLDE